MIPLVLALCLLVFQGYADMYLHGNIRGSNNRLDDENRDRNNANRCFDSQNNNRGGNNVGNLYYYQGSTVHMSWTSQHSCGNPNTNCEVIIQYACDPKVRDGTTQNTIPITNQDCQNFNCDTDVRFCRHEAFSDYQSCLYRRRNKGLFTANQRLAGDSAIFTRQNPNGARRGLECPEERDYYPYWAPSIWRDIAVYTNQPNRCAAYQAESQNVKSRWQCTAPSGWVTQNVKWGKNGFVPITKEECESTAIQWKNSNNVTVYGVWTEVPAWGIDAPLCYENVWCRDNHLGNCRNGYPTGFNWTIPTSIPPSENCVLRIRYNISTGDFEGFANSFSIQSSDVNASLNALWPNDLQPAAIDLWSAQGLNYSDVADCFNNTLNNDPTKLKKCREYVLKTDPQVDIFGSLLTPQNQGKLKLQLAINTAQYGRTFQDRSHRFAIRAKPSNIGDTPIYNVQVQGKRGNIVQVFPGTEYDFYPNILHVKSGEYVHFQWTGSNTNPDNNAGQGRQGSDRHNIVALRPSVYYEGQPDSPITTYGQFGRSYPLSLLADSATQTNTSWRFLGLSYQDLIQLAYLSVNQMGGDVDELNDAGTYFDLGPRQVTQKGVYNYLCTRNNNFSNRGQKAKIVVSDESVVSMDLGIGGGSVTSGAGEVVVNAYALTSVVSFTISSTPNGPESDTRSDYYTVSPLDLPVAPGQSIQIKIPFKKNLLGASSVYRADTMNSGFSKVSASIGDDVATVSTSRGGVYVVRAPNNNGAIAGVTILVVVVLIVGGFFGYRYYKRRQAASKANVEKALAKPSGEPSSPEIETLAPPPPPSAPIKISDTASDHDGQLPPGWQSVQDPKDGAWYYVHPVTGKSQWEFPEA